MTGERPCTRYRRIKVEYLDENFVHRIKNFSGYTAEIIQHEIDHCNGVVV
ncbi:peptide deformylase [Collinsella sp. CLA-AP-H1]